MPLFFNIILQQRNILNLYFDDFRHLCPSFSMSISLMRTQAVYLPRLLYDFRDKYILLFAYPFNILAINGTFKFMRIL